ncbi:hypothetical protein JL722_7048 [Aureococcus anophagefferens]|nr:hypothetical protein JL722_7048 [Aureococcus anophagefferens]
MGSFLERRARAPASGGGAAPEPLEDRESEDADDDSDDREPARPPSDDGDERLFLRGSCRWRRSRPRLIGGGDEARKILRDARDRTVVVHYFLDGADGEACPVRVEPSDVPLSQYHIDYGARPARRGSGATAV